MVFGDMLHNFEQQKLLTERDGISSTAGVIVSDEPVHSLAPHKAFWIILEQPFAIFYYDPIC